jgi:two-component system CheB/CheR fusion protein
MPATKTTLDTLLEFVRDARGFDFTGYKRASIERRVAKRLAEVGVESYDDYIDYLQLHGDEFVDLFNTLLINVTGFFRDPATWEYLAEHVVPRLVETRPPDSPIRIWCAGAASGEEAYTVAMVFARVLGDDGLRERVKIYATDVDEDALDAARHGAYAPRQVEDVPPEALERFFERSGQRYVFRKDLRRCVIFGRNDLVQDAPISRIDLLVCRNTLMYFMAETQSQILRRFHFALGADGVLVLGKSEMLITHTELFTPVELKWRVFRKVLRPALRDRVRVMVADNGAGRAVAENLREAAFDISGAGHVVLDESGALVMVNDTARRMFNIGVSDFGRLIQDLELSYRPVELRGHMETIRRDPRAIDVPAIPWRAGNQERFLDVRVAPLLADGVLLGISVSYLDVTDNHRLEQDLAESRKDVEQAYEELQSTVEELETTNEELQSTNEELETMNDELRHRTLELNDINSFLETILTTIGLAVAVLDGRQHVQIWNGHARELWGLTPEEAEDQHLFSLDIGLPFEKLKAPLRACLNGDSEREEVTVEATNRRGKTFQCRVTCLPLGHNNGQASGLTMMMEPVGGAPGASPADGAPLPVRG